MSEKINKTPRSGWQRVRLGDVVENVNSFFTDRSGEAIQYVAGEHIDEGDLKVRRSGLTSDEVIPPTFNRLFKAGDVLFHSRNIRKLAQPDFDGLTGEKLFVLRTKDQSKLLQALLPFLLQTESFRSYVEERWAGSTNKFLNKTPLMAYEFLLPPIEEQRRVLAPLAAGLGAVDEIHAALAALPMLRRSMEMQLLSMEGVPRKKVGDVAKFTSGKGIRVSDLPKNSSDAHPIPVFGGNGICGYTDTVMAGTSEPTVVIGRVGQFCGVTSMTAGPCWITDNALYPAKISQDIHPAFLAVCLRASNLNRSKLGEYLPLITQEIVHRIEIPIPPSTAQSAAVAKFEQIEEAEISLKGRLQGARALVMHVADKMLEGGANGI